MDWLLSFLSNGLLDAAWWQILVFGFTWTHINLLAKNQGSKTALVGAVLVRLRGQMVLSRVSYG